MRMRLGAVVVCAIAAWGWARSAQEATPKPVAPPAAESTPGEAKAAEPAGNKPDSAASERQGDPYYFTTCAKCAEELGKKGDTYVRVAQGRELRFCTAECSAAFEKDASAGARALDARMIADQRPHYALTASVVSGKALPEKPVEFVWCNRMVRVADEAEKAEFLKDPRKHFVALNEGMIEAQSPAYAMKKCPVQGDILATDDVHEIVVANRMIRLCCSKCVSRLMKKPSKYLALVDYAAKESAGHEVGATPAGDGGGAAGGGK